MNHKDRMGVSKETAQEELEVFLNNIKTVVLSTVDNNGNPFASYSPYAQDEDGNFYVFVSTAVQHSHNMYNSEKAHILFIEDEGKTKHVYARRRLYFNAKAEKFEAEDARFEKIAELFEQKHGKEASLIRNMTDSRFYKLTPYDGNLVLGFGAAFKLDETNKKILKLNTLNGKAHGKAHEDSLDKNE